MVRFAEVDFPRGKPAGSTSTSNSLTTPAYTIQKKSKKRNTEEPGPARKANNDEDLFKVPLPVKKKKKKKSQELTSEESDLLAEEGRKEKEVKDSIEMLSYDTICEGMLSLGRISQIKDHEIMVSLPGRTMGAVPVTSISRAYTKALEKLAATGSCDDPVYGVSDMFKVGQLISVAVIGVDKTGHNTRVTLSMDPKDIQAKYTAYVITPPMILTGAVESIEDHGYVIDLGIHGAHTFLPKDAANVYIRNSNNNKPLGLGQLLKCKVTKARSGARHLEAQSSYLSVTINPKDVQWRMTLEAIASYQLLLPGMESEGTVMETHKTGMKVDFLDCTSHIHLDHMVEPWILPGTVQISAPVFPRVLYLFPTGFTPYLTLQSKITSQNNRISNLAIKLGERVSVKVQRIEKRGIIIKFDSGDRGIVTSTRCSDDATFTDEDIAKKFNIGSRHDCRVLEYSSLDNMYIASFQESMLKEGIVRIDQLTLGQVLRGTLTAWNAGGAIVSVGRVKGFVPKLHFGDTMVHNPTSKFPVGSRFNIKVIKIDPVKNQAVFTAKKRLVKSDGAILSSLDNCPIGAVSEGVIYKVSSLGIIVFTVGGLSGFVPASKATKETRFRLEQLFFVGQVVRFKVVHANSAKSRLILTLFWDEPVPFEASKRETSTEKLKKKKKVKSDENTESEINDEDILKKKKKKKKAKSEENKESEINDEDILQKKKKKKGSKVDVDEENTVAPEIDTVETQKKKKKKKKDVTVDEEAVPVVAESLKKKNKSKKRVHEENQPQVNGNGNVEPSRKKLKAEKRKRKLSAGSSEDEPKTKTVKSEETACLEYPGTSFYDYSYLEKKEESESELSSEEEVETEPKTKAKKKLSKVEREQLHELEVRKAEAELVDPNHVPKSVDDFERLVLASPNSSMIWIAYMSFVLQGADIDRARAVGQRALKTILFREESERENVWKALLNTEAMFGTDESTKDLFKESLKANDDLTMYQAMCSIYEGCSNVEELEKLCKVMVKKFPTNKEVWIYAMNFYYKNGKLDDGRVLFKESLQKLNKTDHILMISRMAVNEFKYGELERGRTVLETTLNTYPKRLDLWLLFAGQLIKKKEFEMAREVLNNATQVKFVPKRMSAILKYYLQFENQHGTPETRQKVKELALQYVAQVDLAPSAYAL